MGFVKPERGLHWAGFCIRGCPVLLAVDSRGDLCERIAIEGEWTVIRAARHLKRMLNRQDPMPVTTPLPQRPRLQMVESVAFPESLALRR